MALAPKPATVQRALAFTAGIAAVAVTYVSVQRQVWRQAAEACEAYGLDLRQGAAPAGQDDGDLSFFGPKLRGTLVRKWNKGVDATVGALATELAKRGL